MKKIVIVGASCRCYDMFVEPLVDEYADKVSITGIYDVNVGRCKIFRKKVGDGLKIYYDFDEMLDSEKPDLVLVATTDRYHHEYVVRSLDKGYDVICEKPLTNTFERFKEIRDA